MGSGIREPRHPVQPLRLLTHREAHGDEAREGGVEHLVEFRAVQTGGATLHIALAGPEDGEPVVLLHGFPDFWLSWARQIPALVEAGYRLIIPDQRGYNLSEKPPEVDAYQMECLGQDVLDLLQALGFGSRKAHLVGHDWGGAVAWWLGQNFQSRWKSLTVLNCPPEEVLLWALKRKPRQMVRSWYIGLFQIPWLPEKLAAAGEYRWLEGALRRAAAPAAFTGGELRVYRKAWSREGALRGMINWYRAARKRAARLSAGLPDPVYVPTTIIWGQQDVALHPLLVERSAACCSDIVVEWIDHAGHWVHREAPQMVTKKMLESFQRGEREQSRAANVGPRV